jgi:hypothetical protein
MFLHLAQAVQQAVQPAPQHRIHCTRIKIWKLVLNPHLHALAHVFKKLGSPSHFLGNGCLPRPPHLVGVNRVRESFDIVFHVLKLVPKHTFVKPDEP